MDYAREGVGAAGLLAVRGGAQRLVLCVGPMEIALFSERGAKTGVLFDVGFRALFSRSRRMVLWGQFFWNMLTIHLATDPLGSAWISATSRASFHGRSR